MTHLTNEGTFVQLAGYDKHDAERRQIKTIVVIQNTLVTPIIHENWNLENRVRAKFLEDDMMPVRSGPCTPFAIRLGRRLSISYNQPRNYGPSRAALNCTKNRIYTSHRSAPGVPLNSTLGRILLPREMFHFKKNIYLSLTLGMGVAFLLRCRLPGVKPPE